MAQLVEHHLAKVRVAGSNPVVRSRRLLGRRVARAVCSLAALVITLSGVVACSSDSRADVVVAAASDTRKAFTEVAEILLDKHGLRADFVFGSSGMLREQVLSGAPYDVYVSANLQFVDEVIDAGVAEAESRRAFAVGRLAVISAAGVRLPNDLAAVADYERIVMANPAHAPYGVAAREALRSLGLYEALQSKLVLADNVADAVRIVGAGEADLGIVALALVIDEPHLDVPTALHQPIRQSLVITTHGSDNLAARRFIEVLESPEGRRILVRYGFMLEST